MKILAIESSCDETAAAIVKDGREILSNIVASSLNIHATTGGIIPERAAREQVKSIIPVIDQSLSKATLTGKEIDAISVTVGPGLIGSLLVGVETAKTLSCLWDKPIIPVNHMVGHIYANFIAPSKPPQLPAIAFVVSGGHTDLVLMKDHGKLTYLGSTRDDAAGEAFDKCARLMSLPYPGGPSISKAAQNYVKDISDIKIRLPRPIIDEDDYDFSFSGLKTAVLREVENLKKANKLNQDSVNLLAYEIQEAITDVLVTKSLKAAAIYSPHSFLLAGGVAANKTLTEKFLKEIKRSDISIDFRVPPPTLCTDNAVYVASCAFYNQKYISWKDISVNPELSITDPVV